MSSRAIVVLLLVATLGLASCGSPAAPTDTTGSTTPTVAGATSAAPPTYAAPTVTAARPCAWTLDVQDPGEASPDAPRSDRSAAEGDLPPNHVDNRSWRQRRTLTTAQTRDAVAVARRLRPALIERCGQGDFSPPAVETDLQVPGWEPYALQPQSAAGEARTAVDFGLSRVSACVVGTSQPGHVDVIVGGTIMDGGCAEPVSH